MFSDAAIIDTDPGVDDVMALAYCEVIKMPLIGITTVHGNSDIENVTNNARFIAQYLSTKPTVYKGSRVSLDGNQYYAESSGENGLGGYDYVLPDDVEIPAIDAIEFMRQALSATETKIDLLCLGPLTNVAILLNLHPELSKKINTIVAMFGVFGEVGNISPVAEFNAYCDPAALKSLLEVVQEQQIPLYVIPANICRKIQITRDELQRIDEALGIPGLKEIVKPYLEYYLNNPTYGGFDGAVLYDLLVPLFYQNQDIFTFEAADISVVAEPGDNHGQTIMTKRPDSSIFVCTNVNGQQAKEQFFSSLAQPLSSGL